MPDTRKEKAARLYARLNRGPAMNFTGPVAAACDLSPDAEAMLALEAQRQARAWLDTWLAPLVLELVPEFRHTEDDRRGADG